MEKHTIQLTLDNYQTYIEIRSTVEVYSTSTSTTFVFEDELDYAYYDNVVVSYRLNNSEIKETRLKHYYFCIRLKDNSTCGNGAHTV